MFSRTERVVGAEKMQKLKSKKGITLIALIVTIVVLLLLATVTIGAVKESNIVGYAKNAAILYNQKQTEEEKKIVEIQSNYGNYLMYGLNN